MKRKEQKALKGKRGEGVEEGCMEWNHNWAKRATERRKRTHKKDGDLDNEGESRRKTKLDILDGGRKIVTWQSMTFNPCLNPLIGGQRYRTRQTSLSCAVKSICYSDYSSLQCLAYIWVSLSLIGPKSPGSFTEVFEWHKLIGFVSLLCLVYVRVCANSLQCTHKRT